MKHKLMSTDAYLLAPATRYLRTIVCHPDVGAELIATLTLDYKNFTISTGE